MPEDRKNPTRDEWGDSTKEARAASGRPLIFKKGDECILQFIGQRDIGMQVALKLQKEEITPALYLIFSDGSFTINLPMGHASKEVDWQKGSWYYIRCNAEVGGKEGRNAMKDLSVRVLGVSGDKVNCPTRMQPNGVLSLTSQEVAEVNYERLNYPLRFQ